MDFIEEDILPAVELYQVEDDLSLTRISNQNGSNNIETGNRYTNHRSAHNKENVCHNVTEPDPFEKILANIGKNDEVQLYSHFFEIVERKENNHIMTKCLGCQNSYKARFNVPSNLVTHLKVSSFHFVFNWIFIKMFFFLFFPEAETSVWPQCL